MDEFDGLGRSFFAQDTCLAQDMGGRPAAFGDFASLLRDVPPTMDMKEYYRLRAQEYDGIYQVARREPEIAELKAWLTAHVRGRSVLEIAAGTGYWTAVAASAAESVTATDLNPEMLSVAEKRKLGPQVMLLTADAYALPHFARRFNAGMAMLWWSHVEKQRQAEFLAHFASRLEAGASLLMIDQIYTPPFSSPITREDEWGNLYTVRTLASGIRFEIIKNYPTDDELHAAFATVCDDISVMRTKEFWALSARVRPRAL